MPPFQAYLCLLLNLFLFLGSSALPVATASRCPAVPASGLLQLASDCIWASTGATGALNVVSITGERDDPAESGVVTVSRPSTGALEQPQENSSSAASGETQFPVEAYCWTYSLLVSGLNIIHMLAACLTKTQFRNVTCNCVTLCSSCCVMLFSSVVRRVMAVGCCRSVSPTGAAGARRFCTCRARCLRAIPLASRVHAAGRQRAQVD